MTGGEITTTSYTRNNRKGFAMSQLLGRGWTRSTIARCLGPYAFTKNGKLLYPRKQALKIEKQQWWQFERRDHKRNARTPSKAERGFLATVKELPLQIDDVKDLYATARVYHSDKLLEQGHNSQLQDEVSENVLKRWAVNMLRHNCAGYDLFYKNRTNGVYSDSEFCAVKYKILMEIERKYPILQSECQRQKDMILKNYNYIGEYLDD